MAIFMSDSAMSLMVGSPLASFVMDRFSGFLDIAGWQWLFLVEGLPSIVVGIAAVFVLTDKPKNSRWLSATEKEHVAFELAAK